MLFLDDDIRKINVEKLRAAAALLAEYPVVGLQVSKYPRRICRRTRTPIG